MDLTKTFRYAGLCAGIAVLAFTASPVLAFDDDGEVEIATVTPAATPNLSQNINGGQYVVIQHATDTANIVISPTGVITPDAGIAGDARMIPVDTSGTLPLLFSMTDAMDGVTMSFQIGDPGAGAGQFDGATVTLDSAVPADGDFTASLFTCEPDPAGATAPDVGTMPTYVAATGLGTITPEGTDPTDGAASVRCGVTITTNAASGAYPTGAYDGDVRISVNY